LLLEKQLRAVSAGHGAGQAGLKSRLYTESERPLSRPHRSTVEVVIKIGGGLLSQPCHLDTLLTTVCAAARERRLVIVPGGGPFADTVRHIDQQTKLSDDAAHWMAVLGMDQYAHLIASRLNGGVIVETSREIIKALDEGKVPVLTPSRWLRTADPLPHSWDVTSDSIAAWVAGQLGTNHLVLVKPPGAGAQARHELVDAYFERALPSSVKPVIVAADQIERLRLAIGGTSG
jgi:dihydroneopterin aldolase